MAAIDVEALHLPASSGTGLTDAARAIEEAEKAHLIVARFGATDTGVF